MKRVDSPVSKRKRFPLWLLIPGILVGLIVLAWTAVTILFAVYFFPTPTGKIAPNVYAVHDGIADLFLITDGQTWIAVDSGQNPSMIAREMKKIGVRPDQVSAVLLTHTDYDHAGGLSALPNADIYLLDKEEPLITHKVQRKPGFYNSPLPRGYQLLHHDQTLSFSRIKVQVIATPGHTIGSAAYVINGTMLFTGDTLALTRDGKVRVRLFYKIHNMDDQTERSSIHKLAKLKGLRWIFNPHTGFRHDPEGAFAGW